MAAPANASRAGARMRARSSGDGGSPAQRGVQRAGSDRERAPPHHAVRQRADRDLGGSAAHVDHRERAGGGGGSSVRAAPWKASRASSSPLRMSASTPARSRSARTRSAPLAAPRIAAVATTRSRSQPCSWAARRCSATTSATTAIVASGIIPSASRAADAGERAQLHHLGEPGRAGFGHQQPRRVRPDVDAGAAHGARDRAPPPITGCVVLPWPAASSPLRSARSKSQEDSFGSASRLSAPAPTSRAAVGTR